MGTKSINFKTIYFAIQILASIGTFVSSVMVFFTLKEMKEQRKLSTKPEIALSNEKVNVFISKSCNKKCLWSTEREIFSSCDLDLNTNDVKLKGFNIGLGAAKNIHVKWKYDICKIVNLIKNDENLEVNIKLDDNSLRIDYKLIFLNNEVKFNYLLPVNIDNNYLDIDFPQPYIELCTILLYSDIKEFQNIDRKFYFMNLPELELELIYDDISKNNYVKTYKIFFNYYEFSINKQPTLVGEIVVI